MYAFLLFLCLPSSTNAMQDSPFTPALHEYPREFALLVNDWIANKRDDLDMPLPSLNGQRLLHRACINEEASDITSALLAAGANPNVTSDDGETPLLFACMFDGDLHVKALLEHGADPNISGGKERKPTPLHNLCIHPIPQSKIMVKLLLAYGADIFKNDSYGSNALQLAHLDPRYAHTTCYASAQIVQFAKHLLLHKPAYLRLLTRNTSILNAFPTDIVKLIIDAKFPGYPPWPKENFMELVAKLEKKK